MISIYNKKLKIISIRLNNLGHNWSISQKISYGYTLAIGIAFIGTISGLLIGNYYEKNAHKQLNLSYQQQSLLKDLENSVITVRLHPQRLITVLENSIWLEFEKSRFLKDADQVNQQLSVLEAFVKTHPDDLALDIADYQNLLKDYKRNTDLYTQMTKQFWQQIELNNLPVQDKKKYQEKLLTLFKGKEAVNLNVNFEKLSDELSLIIRRAEIQQQQANVSFNSAQKLRVTIIVGGIILSSMMAALLALYTTNLIALPLQVVTNVAQKITQQSNFQLRANVQSNDEVGTLATSLNQLVAWIGDYTQQLELARQNLEQRVEERTQELQIAQQNLEQRVEERTQELQTALQELKQTQGQLIQTEKMSSLGLMVAGIAHEINNPVNFINGNIECAGDYIEDLLDLVNLYQQEYPEPSWIILEKVESIDLPYLSEDLSKLLASMKIGAKRIREIVLSLRNFSRLDESDMKEVDIHEGIDNTLLILNHQVKQGVEVVKKYGDLPLIECYPAQLNQVFMNILNNALDALLDYNNQVSKQIMIETLRVDNDYVKVLIKDNGPGISPEIINKLFDPFFTTKSVGKGTGCRVTHGLRKVGLGGKCWEVLG